MVQTIPHSQCGVFIAVTGSGANQVVFIARTPDMLAAKVYYSVGFNMHGWALLSAMGVGPTVWLSTMGFKRVAVENDAGRVAVQDQAEKRLYWVDDTEEVKKKVMHTIEIRNKWKLVYSIFSVQREILDSRHLSPYKLLIQQYRNLYLKSSIFKESFGGSHDNVGIAQQYNSAIMRLSGRFLRIVIMISS